jgi:hypothetical protein
VVQGRHYDISPDGKRFLLMKDAETSGTARPAEPELKVVLHFFDELKRLVEGH